MRTLENMTEPRIPERRVLDVAALKALAHPLRTRILDQLSVYGPLTATGLAERLGESSGATSYHLRQLEKHRFVREVVGRGTARERWWERVPGGLALEYGELPRDASTRAASRIVEREWERARSVLLAEFLERGDDVLAESWRDASTLSTSNLRLTAPQLAEVVREVEGVIDRIAARFRDQKDHPVPGSRPVQLHFNAFPVLDAEETPMSAAPSTVNESDGVER